MIRVLLADDQALVRSGLRMLIDAADDMEVVGEVPNGADAVAMVRTREVDVVLMDVIMENDRAGITARHSRQKWLWPQSRARRH